MSPEPNVTAVQKQMPYWLLVFACFVVLGSFYPFRFQGGTLSEAIQQWATTTNLSKSDLAINLLAGVPIGFLGLLSFVGNGATRKRVSGATIAALVVSVVLSTFVEVGQHYVPTRVSSRFDTIAQIVGAVLGIVVAVTSGRWICDRLQQLGSPNRVRSGDALLDVYLFGYLIFMFQPFVPAISPTELSAKWKSGGVSLVPFLEWSTNLWGAAYTAIVCTSTAIPVGAWFARRLSTWQLAPVAVVAAVAVVGLEAMQVAIEMRTCSADDALWSSAGAITGVGLLRYFWVELQTFFRLQGRVVLVRVTLLFVVLYFLASLAPFSFVTSTSVLADRWERFMAEPVGLRGNDFIAGSNLVRISLWSAVLGVLATLSVRRDQRGVLWGLILVLVAFAEFLQLFSNSHSPSLLAAAARTLGATLGCEIVKKTPLGTLGGNPTQLTQPSER
ncbi:MAG: VanZ family protein [Planctomycetota bacterium]